MSAPRSPLRRDPDRDESPMRHVFLIGLGCVALAAGALFGPKLAVELTRLARSAPFRVQTVSVVGAQHVTAQRVVAATGLQRGTPLLDVDPAAVALRVAELPQVDAARAVRLPPGRVVVGVHERVARGLVAGAGGAAFLVCRDGVPFAPAGPGPHVDLPLLVTPGHPVAGQAEPGLTEAVAVAAAAAAAGFAVAEVRISGSEGAWDASVRLVGLAAEVALGRTPERDAALERLAKLVKHRPEWVAGATSIDVRFAGRGILRSDQPAETRDQRALPEGTPEATAARGYETPSNRPAAG